MKLFLFERFDQNEIFLLLCLIVVYLIAWRMPKRLPSSINFLLFLWGFTVPTFYDFTFGGGLYDYYDVNDSSRYCLLDLATYVMYAPFGYFFAYCYEKFRVGPRTSVLYILAWALVALGFEWVTCQFKVIHYKEGYTIFYSFPIYLFTESLTLLFYKWIRGSSNKKSSSP